jgi:hypothetical protein
VHHLFQRRLNCTTNVLSVNLTVHFDCLVFCPLDQIWCFYCKILWLIFLGLFFRVSFPHDLVIEYCNFENDKEKWNMTYMMLIMKELLEQSKFIFCWGFLFHPVGGSPFTLDVGLLINSLCH